MTYAPTPAFAPLPVEHARAARRAGALGGALVGVGLPIALSPAFAWGSTGLQAWVATLPGNDPDGMDADTRAVFEHMLQALSSPIGIVATVVCLLLGGGLVALGIVTTIRRLRRAGVHRPVAVALLGLLLARVGTWVVGTLLGGLPELLLGAWLPPLIGIGFGHVYGDSGGPTGAMFVLAAVLIVIVGVVAAAGTWLGTGILTTWWMARALREKVPVVVAMQPWPVEGWPASEPTAPRSQP
ncbi:hypothetical protein [Agrococcus jejuensis]|uniref:Uncharacterized protein n=1 Tax=Agrococcus jejuensis TaxID=399736 RepID=A0A1G8CL04_9MICO|nr:hypothetical protein [Agrococcus jejuensis]SDH46066.1 hypothetical protein SAMN04489720_1327 [Agrococcus jejuensis]